MDKKEKVIRGLECCRQNTPDDPFQQCGACPYNINGIYVEDCRSVLSGDALEVLKEQEETTFILGKYYEPMCEKCGFHPFAGYIPTLEWMKQRGYKRCPHCGRAVKWDK